MYSLFTVDRMWRIPQTLLLVLLCHYSLTSRTDALASIPYGSTTRNVATQILQGVGEVQVDMNRYNLNDVEEIQKEWTAERVQRSSERVQGAVYLGCRSKQSLFVDTVTVTFPRCPDQPGLGLLLTELAGGREDGLGITLIDGLAETGSAPAAAAAVASAGATGERVDIFPGDSIAKVILQRCSSSSAPKSADADASASASAAPAPLEERRSEYVATTECLSYDATVRAIQGLPPPEPGDAYVLKLKRIRRKPVVEVTLQYPPSQDKKEETVRMFAGENLRQGMLVRGVQLNDGLAQRYDGKAIGSGNCGAGGLCRTCMVQVQSGADLLNEPRAAEKQMLVDSPRWRLACKTVVGTGMREGKMTVRVHPRQW